MNLVNTINKPVKEKITIGLLIDWVGPGYQISLLEGIKDTLEINNANFICFEGSSLSINKEHCLKINPIFDLAGTENCDGLILASGNISQVLSDDLFKNFCERYNDIPLVSIGRKIENIPSIIIDNKTGINEMIRHLVEFHGYKNFAIIRGPDYSFDANERFSAMIESFSLYSISVNPENIIIGDYKFHSGIEGIKLLLDKNNKFDAVIVANDSMAYGAIEELTYRGFHVPGDIAVVGFDNIIYPGTTSPPLTTINQPIYKLASTAAKMILDIIQDKNKIYANVVFPTNIIIRETCGCFSHNILDSKVIKNVFNNKKLNETLVNDKDKIIKLITDNLKNDFNININKFSDFLEQIINNLFKELFENKKNLFLKTLHYLLHLSLYQKEEVIIWEKIISEIRLFIIPYIDNIEFLIIVENIFHESRLMISEKIIIGEQNRYFSTILDNELINYFRDEIQDIYDIEEQFKIMIDKFSNLRVKSCYIVLYNNEQKLPDKNFSRLIFGYSNNYRLLIDENYFNSKYLLPDNFFRENEKFFFIITSLGYSTEQSGYMIFEFYDFKTEIYGNLKRIISNSIQESFFIKKIQDQSDRLQSQKEDLAKSLADLRKTMGGFIQTMSLTIETRDLYTAGHQRRVSDLARAIATEMDLPHHVIEGIRMAGIIHDLGKIYIPIEILNKPGKLLDIEFELIKAHPQIAYDILKTIEFPWPIADIVLQHHEKLDGSGYPNGLKGNEIKLESCILSVADVVEAMTTYRPYRAALGIEIALGEISKFKGIKYKSEVVDACMNLFLKNKFHFK